MRATATVMDPKKAKAEQEKAEAERIRVGSKGWGQGWAGWCRVSWCSKVSVCVLGFQPCKDGRIQPSKDGRRPRAMLLACTHGCSLPLFVRTHMCLAHALDPLHQGPPVLMPPAHAWKQPCGPQCSCQAREKLEERQAKTMRKFSVPRWRSSAPQTLNAGQWAIQHPMAVGAGWVGGDELRGWG